MFGRLVSAARARSAITLVAAVAITIGCWILGNPRSSGPDEPSHMIASAGLVRGDRNGAPNPDPLATGTRLFRVPAMVGAPDPVCWVRDFDPNVPVACADAMPLADDVRNLPSTSFNYPPWALLLPGLASYVGWASGYAYLARLLSAAIPIALVAAALLRLRPERLAPAALVGLTPIAWFTFGVVNPSAMAIAGGLALWAGLLAGRRPAGIDWLPVCGWAAVLLARRDGPLWATMIVVAACWVTARSPARLWKAMPAGERALVASAAALAPITPLWNGDRDLNLVISLAPAGLLAIEWLTRRWQSLQSGFQRRAFASYVGLGSGAAIAALVSLRPGGFEATTLRLIVGATGRHLDQLVGNLGWLSTPVPTIARIAFWATIGGALGVTVLEARRSAFGFATGLAAAIVVAWILEYGHGADYGEYWQGRYSMPFAIGLPIVLGWRSDRTSAAIDRLAPGLCWSSFAVVNIAFVSSQQRWAVGVGGSWLPWRWDTWHTPTWPVALVLVHVASTATMAAWALVWERDP